MSRRQRVIVASDEDVEVSTRRPHLLAHEDDTQHSTPDSISVTLSSDNDSDHGHDQQPISNTHNDPSFSHASSRRHSHRSRRHFNSGSIRAHRNALDSRNESSISDIFSNLRNNFEYRNIQVPNAPSTHQAHESSISHSSTYFNAPSTSIIPSSEQSNPLVVGNIFSGHTSNGNHSGLTNLPTTSNPSPSPPREEADSDIQMSEVHLEAAASAAASHCLPPVSEFSLVPPSSSSTETASSAAPAAQPRADLNASTLTADNSCMICMEPWTSAGEHRLVSLRCGHLFGRTCIQAWLDSSGTKNGGGGLKATCPNCKKLFARKDITVLFPRGSLLVLDTSELEAIRYSAYSFEYEYSNCIILKQLDLLVETRLRGVL